MNDRCNHTQGLLKQIWQRDGLYKIAGHAARKRAASSEEWALPEDIQPRKQMIYLNVGIPDSDELPRKDLNHAMQAVMAGEGDASLRYGFGQGYYPVRRYLAEKYNRDKGLGITEDWFQITNGSSGAIDLAARSLIDPGDVIVTESPCYMGSLANFIGVGADICPVSMDESGLIVAELKRKIRTLKARGKRIKLVYTISAFQNPTGRTLSRERKEALLELAAREKFMILDDNAYGDLYFGSLPSPALSELSGGFGVLTVGTFSKVVATGIRVGWIHAHPDAIRLLGRMRFDMGQNQMALRMMARFLDSGCLEPHIERMRRLYKDKMMCIADLMDAHLSEYVSFYRPGGGFYLWVGLAAGLTARNVWRAAVREGVAVNPGHSFFPDKSGESGEYLRIAYSWCPMDQLEQAVLRLKSACRRVADGDIV